MKFKLKQKKYPKHGETRIITKFLVLPLKIKDEIRWLEKATIEQVYSRKDSIDEISYYFYWKNVRFIDNA